MEWRSPTILLGRAAVVSRQTRRGTGPKSEATWYTERVSVGYPCPSPHWNLTSPHMKQHLLLGTAGHIDHGKTALVAALTGVDTDRLPEEKQRQITIDLGFAPLDLGEISLGIVDVPGHERFVKNMLAGASGVDLAMLVVAADDSVKPQTREHLDILRYLRLETGVLVITKCDLADTDWIDLVETEIRELTTGTFLAEAPIVRVSTRTGLGLDELRNVLSSAAEQVLQRRENHTTSYFRMAVDRVFTIAGHGTVVTGSVASGVARVGDDLELQPQAIPVRVRGLQSHDADVPQVGRGQRAAINLKGVHYNEISRGQILATGGVLRASRLLTVELQLTEQLARPMKDRSPVRLHLGTASLPGKVVLLGASTVEPGTTTFAQLFLSQDVATVWGQPFVIRSISPVETLGGGRILDPSAVRIKRLSDPQRQHLEDLAGKDLLRRAAAAAYFADCKVWQPSDLAVLAGASDPAAVLNQLLLQQTVVSFPLDNGSTIYLHDEVATGLRKRFLEVMKIEHAKTPLRKYVERSRLTRHFQQVSLSAFEGLCAAMQNQGELTLEQPGLALVDWAPQLSKSQQSLLEEIVAAYLAAQLQPVTMSQLASALGQPSEEVAELAEVAVGTGELVRISKDLRMHREAERHACQLLAEEMAGGKGMTVSQIRDLLGTTRKIAVPLCEYLDATGLTRRQGDLRHLASPHGALTTHA